MRRLEEPVRLDPVAADTLILHGDTLCTDDDAYQRFRARVRDPAWQARMLSRPAWVRRALAVGARALSRWRTRDKPQQIMDVNPGAVEACFREHQVQRIIHGHTHRPALHELTIDGQPCQRVVLGDWHVKGSVVRLVDGGVELLDLERSERGELTLRIRAAG